MDTNFVLIQFNKSNENKKIILITKHYKEIKKYLEEHKEDLIGYSFEI